MIFVAPTIAVVRVACMIISLYIKNTIIIPFAVVAQAHPFL